MRGEDRSDKMMKTACEEVQMTDATMPVDSITLFCMTCNFLAIVDMPAGSTVVTTRVRIGIREQGEQSVGALLQAALF